MDNQENNSTIAPDRRAFLRTGALAAATTAFGMGASRAFADDDARHGGSLPAGDVAILRFLAAAEIIESDLWQQYNELAGLNGGSAPYISALAVLDADMQRYVTDNTRDEISHENFLNAYLTMHGAMPVNLNGYRNLPSSKATGARQVGRITNLMDLTIDTSFWTRYRSPTNPDFGAEFPQVVNISGRTAIPRDNAELADLNHVQAIANTAGFHFAFIEQGGSSLYAAMTEKVTSLQVLRIVVSIGGTEIQHFQTWQDKAANVPPLTDAGLVFPDFSKPPFNTGIFEGNKIMPVPCEFISPDLPRCSIIRPTDPNGIAAGAVRALTEDGLFIGQSSGFFAYLGELAEAADAARRGRG